MVYAEFGGQTECIMGNWKIENSTSPSSGRRQRCVTETGIKKESTHIKALDWLWFLGHDQGICFANYCHHII